VFHIYALMYQIMYDRLFTQNSTFREPSYEQLSLQEFSDE
jgi:hypothetical protein